MARPKLKPMYAGFITRDRIIPKGHWAEPHCRTWSCRVEWGKLEPTRGVRDRSIVDRFLEDSYARGMEAMRVRWYGGWQAPQWFKDLGVGPVLMVNDWDGIEGYSGAWWQAENIAAYRETCQWWQDTYGSEPMLREIIASLSTDGYPEIFIRGMSSPRTRDSLRAAGYTWELDKASMRAMVNAHRLIRTTRCGLQFNPPQNPEARDWRGAIDLPFAFEFMDYARSRIGQRAVFENTSLNEPGKTPQSQKEMYDGFAARPNPISLQTVRVTNPLKRIGDPDKAFTYAVEIGCSSIETVYDGNVITPQLLAKYDPLLRANA